MLIYSSNNPLLKYLLCFDPNKVSIHVTILYHHANLQTNGKESSEENPSIIDSDGPPLFVNIP